MKTFQYNGHTVTLEIFYDHDDDCIKAFHDLVRVDTGKSVTTLPWYPYSNPSDTEVEAWLVLGAPQGIILKRPWGEQHVNFSSDVLSEITSGSKTIYGCEYTFRRTRT